MNSDNVSVIDTRTNTVTDTIRVGRQPNGVAFTPDGRRAYVPNFNSDNVSVINTHIKEVTKTIDVGDAPYGVAVTPQRPRD